MAGSICLYSTSSEVLLVQFEYVYLRLGFFGIRVLKYCRSMTQNKKIFTVNELGYNI